MELTSEQKHDISVELNASDIYETVPFLNKVLAAIGYVDRLEDDSEREELRWTKRKEPLIKDEKIRKAVRAWAEAIDYRVDNLLCIKTSGNTRLEISDGSPKLIYISLFVDKGTLVNIKDRTYYTIAELCGEED